MDYLATLSDVGDSRRRLSTKEYIRYTRQREAAIRKDREVARMRSPKVTNVMARSSVQERTSFLGNNLFGQVRCIQLWVSLAVVYIREGCLVREH
jgi:hypothetical protein